MWLTTYTPVSRKASALFLHQEAIAVFSVLFFPLLQSGDKNVVHKIVFIMSIFIFSSKIKMALFCLCSFFLTLPWPVLRWLFSVQMKAEFLLSTDTVLLSCLKWPFFPPSNNYNVAFLTCFTVFHKTIIAQSFFVPLCPSFKGWIGLSQVHRALWCLTTASFKAQSLWTASRQFLPAFCLTFSFYACILVKKEVFKTKLWAHCTKKMKLHHLMLVRLFPLVMVLATVVLK